VDSILPLEMFYGADAWMFPISEDLATNVSARLLLFPFCTQHWIHPPTRSFAGEPRSFPSKLSLARSAISRAMPCGTISNRQTVGRCDDRFSRTGGSEFQRNAGACGNNEKEYRFSDAGFTRRQVFSSAQLDSPASIWGQWTSNRKRNKCPRTVQ